MGSRDHENEENFVISSENAESDETDEQEEYYETASESFKKRSIVPYAIGAIGLLVAIIIFVSMFSNSRDIAGEEQIQDLEARVIQLEETLAKIEWIDKGLARLDKQEKDLASLSERVGTLESGIDKKLAHMSNQITKLQQQPGAPPQKKTSPSPPKKAEPKFHTVQKGDTLYSISRKYGVTVAQLTKYNNLSSSTLSQGQKLKLAP